MINYAKLTLTTVTDMLPAVTDMLPAVTDMLPGEVPGTTGRCPVPQGGAQVHREVHPRYTGRCHILQKVL